jgi:hypothetical protein
MVQSAAAPCKQTQDHSTHIDPGVRRFAERIAVQACKRERQSAAWWEYLSFRGQGFVARAPSPSPLAQ